MPKRGEINGLPGWHYVTGEWRDAKGKTHTTRHAEHYLSGESISVRDAQQRSHHGEKYEKRVSPTSRKTYKRKLKNSRYTRFGPYYSIDQLLTAEVPDKKYALLEVFGTIEEYAGSGLADGKNHQIKFSTLSEFKDLKTSLHQVLDGKPRTVEARIIHVNLQKVRETKRYYITVRDL